MLFFPQVFVANPNKTPPIQEILVKNKDKLVEFLTSFHNDRTGNVVIICQGIMKCWKSYW